MEFHKNYDIRTDPRMINCRTQCGNTECRYKNYECWAEKTCSNYKPPLTLTRADEIRAMTDEELAEWLNHMQTDAYDRGLLKDRIVGYPNNYGSWLGWLRKEAVTK